MNASAVKRPSDALVPVVNPKKSRTDIVAYTAKDKQLLEQVKLPFSMFSYTETQFSNLLFYFPNPRMWSEHPVCWDLSCCWRDTFVLFIKRKCEYEHYKQTINVCVF